MAPPGPISPQEGNMRTMILDTAYSALKFVRLRWEFLTVLGVAVGILTAAALTWNMALAMVGAVVAFGAGEAKASQVLCNDCAADMVMASSEIPEHVT
jgi:hypothetical protein